MYGDNGMEKDNRKYRICFIDYMWYVAEIWHENAETHLEKCPKCGSTHLDKLQRITGYLVGTTDRWNKAKLAELNDRVVHN